MAVYEFDVETRPERLEKLSMEGIRVRQTQKPAKGIKHPKQVAPPPIEVEQTFVIYQRRDGVFVAILATFKAPESWTSIGMVDAYSADEALAMIA